MADIVMLIIIAVPTYIIGWYIWHLFKIIRKIIRWRR